MTDDEFLQMLPAALELLMRRLQVHDRKQLTVGAKVEAAIYNVNRSKESWADRPEPYSATDFLPELPEDRRRRLREEAQAAARTPQDLAKDPAFLAWKAKFQAM